MANHLQSDKSLIPAGEACSWTAGVGDFFIFLWPINYNPHTRGCHGICYESHFNIETSFDYLYSYLLRPIDLHDDQNLGKKCLCDRRSGLKDAIEEAG